MDRRSLLKIAPLAALAAVPIKVGAHEGTAMELKSNKRYVFAFKGDMFFDEHFAASFRENCERMGIDGIWIVGDVDLTIYELDAK